MKHSVRIILMGLALNTLVLTQAPGEEKSGANGAATSKPPRLEFRMVQEQLKNPYWYESHGYLEDVRGFWDKNYWETALRERSDDGYNAILWYCEPWVESKSQWQGLLIRHNEYPEARAYTPEQYDRIIAQVNWIFTRAHKLGMQNYLFDYQVTTTPAFARAHGLDSKKMTVSAELDYRHNLDSMDVGFGVRNELTRAFTETTTAELFQTYKNLDGLCGNIGEALPGKRSTWFREAIVPGLKRSGRHPRFIVSNWMLPLEDFQADIAPTEVYNNTWASVLGNVEEFTDTKPYPMAVRWAEKSGVPTMIEFLGHNGEANFPFNSPRLAYDIIREYSKVENCKGILNWWLRSNPNQLFCKALTYYAKNDIPYSEERWIDLLAKDYGDREAARHFLKAYDASARILTDTCAIAWEPMDRGCSRQLMLPYWYWSREDPRWTYEVSPVRAGMLLPVRYYARVVAKLGRQFVDNNGADFNRNLEHPGAQELFWGLGDYPVTPEAHMRQIRLYGDECLREADEAMKTVKTNPEKAERVYNYMKAYELLTEFYQKKVLAATSALIYGYGGDKSYRDEAEKLADEAVERYTVAINFIWENIDKKKGEIKGRWDREFTMPELIEREKAERKQLPSLFSWPAEDAK